MTLSDDPLWYKDAIIYELHVRAFADSNGDGIGDFPGLTARLDYLQQLGINTIWLLPFYPSPLRDGGYDIAEYASINPDYGTMRDFTRFVNEAHRRGMRVITELVVNHTSDQHPWFQRARKAPAGSVARNWYVWSDTDKAYSDTRVIFTDTETSNWAWDPIAGQYYWHRFFSHQPDLNYANPQVLRAIERVMAFWFDRGVDGLRLDAVPYLCEREGTNNENLPETHEVLKGMRSFVDEHYPGRMLLAEANQLPSDVRAYFGDGDECHMAFHFPVMPRLFMALRQEDRRPIVDILEQTPAIPESAQWGLFLRNHDELTLEMVTDEERDYMYSIYATDPRMRVNVGIRRRLAPLLGNNRRAIELLHALLFSLPGTPILYYGDELGMGDNTFLGDRDGVRTPMQWSGDRNGGFSRSDPASLYLPLIADPLYGYQAVNVEAQERSASSLLNWMRRMIALRGRRPAFGRGDLTILYPTNRAIVAFLRQHEGAVTLVVANLSRFVQPVELDLHEHAGTVPTEVIGQQPFPPISEDPYFLSLGPHAFYWFDLVPQPIDVGPAPGEDVPTVRLVAGDWRRLFDKDTRGEIERELIPAYLKRQRWFAAGERETGTVYLRDIVPIWDDEAGPAWLVLADAGSESTPDVYVLLLAVASGRGARRITAEFPNAVVGRVESARGSSVLYDATAADHIVGDLLNSIAQQRVTDAGGTRLTAHSQPAFGLAYEALDEPPAVIRPTDEQSNTSLRMGSAVMLKLIRRFEPGVHPEIELGRHLSEHPGLSPRLLGQIDLETPAGRGPVLVAHEFVWSRENGWNFTVAACLRFLDEHAANEPSTTTARHPLDLAAEFNRVIDATHLGATPSKDAGPPEYASHVIALGEATARLHLALSEAGGDPAFEPEPLAAEDLSEIAERIRDRLQEARPALRRVIDEGSSGAVHASAILELEDALLDWASKARDHDVGTVKIRVHGDYHLGQVLDADGRFVILDFEGEVGRPLHERREKASVFTDIAGMLRSLSYAGLTARQTQLLTVPEGDEPRQRIDGWVTSWEQRASAGFLSAYLAVAGDAPFLPRRPEDARWLLDLHLLDKALHEVNYEARFRPDWLHLPLEGLARIATWIVEGKG